MDYVGDIESKLKNNKLKYSKKVVSVDEGLNGIFNDLYDPLVPKQNNKMQYFQSKRLISIVDRRHQNPEAKDDIFMFEPPMNSRDIFLCHNGQAMRFMPEDIKHTDFS